MVEKQIADYFIISGIPEKPELISETKPYISSVLPITDITVIFKGHGEECPIGYTCIEETPCGHVADLNNGNFKSPNIQICFRRGNDKPPLVDVGVLHEDKDRVLPDVEVVRLTPYGRSASTGNIGSKTGTFITYRRAKTINPFNQLVVVDLCVILNNKNEYPPHAFYSIKKNLNKSYYGMIGSEVFLCYKKTMLSPPSLCFTPHIISRFPLQDYADFPLPETVPLFCLPAGVNVELRPSSAALPRPTTSTFVLTTDSAQKIYGSSICFYEPYDQSMLNQEQRARLGLRGDEDLIGEEQQQRNSTSEVFAHKSICILSRWPFFDCFEKFLMHLYRLVFVPARSSSSLTSPSHKIDVPLEHHISHFLLDVSFPSPQRPTVHVQLTPGTDEEVVIRQPSSKLPLPLTGASYIHFLSTLGVDNAINVLLFALCEQKILLHSLNPWVLTGVAEAITAMLFPFYWQCPYVPLCPMSLHGILNAPLPFIVGIDSRCFDTFTPPDDVICIDLDTRSIFLSELKKCLNPRILPRRAARVLRNSLEKIFQKWTRISQAIGANQSPQHRSTTVDAKRQQIEKQFELEIQEAFVRFMATILRGFRSYLLPITSAPTVGATDPTSLFNFEGFLTSRDRNYSQFYTLITRTQMFTHYIEERSFVSDKDTSLAFFDVCEEKLISSEDIFSDRPVKLFDTEDATIKTDRSVFIPAPEQSPSIGPLSQRGAGGVRQQTPSRKLKFGPLNPALFHRHPQLNNFPSLDRALDDTHIAREPNSSFSISRRTKQEVKTSQKMARKSAETPFNWAKYLLSCSHCLWFSMLPSYIAYCNVPDQSDSNSEFNLKSTARILRYAYATIVRMQKLKLSTDEICFRVLTLLCGYHGQPALAVRVFFEMKKAGIKPNTVTYGYYNKALLESRWPDHSSKPTTVLWTKIRNVINGISLFKFHGRIRMEQRHKRSIQFMGDPSFANLCIDTVDRANSTNYFNNDLFRPTTLPIEHTAHNNHDKTYRSRGGHRRSLVNRSFSTYQKGSLEGEELTSNPICDPQPCRNAIHKSSSMHLRHESPERESLIRTKSSSLEDDDEPAPCQKFISAHNNELPQHNKKTSSANDSFLALREKCQLLNMEMGYEQALCQNLELVDSSAGILFSTHPEARAIISRSESRSPIQSAGLSASNQQHCDSSNNQPTATDSFLLQNQNLTPQNHMNDGSNVLLIASSFGEDAKILQKIESHEQKPNFFDSIQCLGAGLVADDVSSEETKSNRLSESITDQSGGLGTEEGDDQDDGEEDDAMLKNNITSTPNFKIAALINDASNLQWSKWTSSQNSKSVYKSLKSAATGIVSSLQEIKSSFSISNSATPSKFLSSAHNKSATTREMLSQWANYFSLQPPRGYEDDSDDSSVASNELFRLSNEEDIDPSASESIDFKFCNEFFQALEKHYNNLSSKEDLIDHITGSQNVSDSVEDEVAIEVKMTTCSRCTVCHSLLYDEEIMERWSHNESNLNTRCIYCRAKIVPLMSIFVEDRRFSAEQQLSPAEEKTTLQQAGDVSFDLVDLDDKPNGSAKLSSDAVTKDDNRRQTAAKPSCMKRDSLPDSYAQQNFTVPYLSPIVLRKELESVFESSGDNCPASSRFVDEHPIIFWNLLWYFTRINVPTHLALLCLSAKSILDGKEIDEKSPAGRLDKVVVRCLWDNDKLHAEIGKPLYRMLERGDPSIQVQAILCDELYFTKSFLERVIDLIKINELLKAMDMILNARLKSSMKFSFDKNRHNLHRDLMFLINVCLGPGRLFMVIRSEISRCYELRFKP